MWVPIQKSKWSVSDFGALNFHLNSRNCCSLRTLCTKMRVLQLILSAFLFNFTVRASVGNSYGRLFRVSTFGESHGAAVGVIIDGCPPRIPLLPEDVQSELARRKPGQSRLTTPRSEEDLAVIMSGVTDGLTTGAPICIIVKNKDQRSHDYDEMSAKYRPSHADATYDAKYGLRSIAGGGRSSARETIARVAAGAIAKKVLSMYCNLEIIGYVKKVQEIEATVDVDTVQLQQVRLPLRLFPYLFDTT